MAFSSTARSGRPRGRDLAEPPKQPPMAVALPNSRSCSQLVLPGVAYVKSPNNYFVGYREMLANRASTGCAFPPRGAAEGRHRT